MVAFCSRVDCGEPAAAVFGFDAGAALVWLDPFDGKAKGAGMLCAEHADSLTPIRGWNLQDRRVRAPRLWAERPRVVTPSRPAPRRARRPRHQVTGSITPREQADALPFSARADIEPERAPTVAHEQGADGGADLDRLLDARTPLLARAFQSARTA